jgi:mRNA interferase MazF
MNLNPGEVWLADLGIAAKTRPVVIVSRHDLDPPRALAIYVPLTTKLLNGMINHHTIRFLTIYGN